ncbi:MAG TPA: tubulin-like doman-containing protein [Herpetosiphonaceae bacterium]|nr:tubulin-like doman-containing protein [Herpetosiphonaceae bacterium]
MTKARLTIYPTFVIGLGGTGTSVVRQVKHRFLRTWHTSKHSAGRPDGSGASPSDYLPSLLQILAVDTEPLVNGPDQEPLYHHEFAYMGRFDATRLVSNKHNHEWLRWWNWAEDELPLGYIHNGAKQIRPIGRLAFFRNYVSFKSMLVKKLNEMRKIEAIQEAQEEGFAVVSDHRIIYIVSSLCGGTGAGMFIDAAHAVRHHASLTVGNATIIGIFMMPSVFEDSTRSDLQRRRIQANAYAALKELNHFQTQQGFRELYPSEQDAIPTVPYRPFTRVFLVERTNENGQTLSTKAAAEQMSAHLIDLITFSYMNQTILGQDVNVTEERQSNGAGAQRSYLSYSTFGVSGMVMPRAALWRYFCQRAIALMVAETAATPPNEPAVWSRYERLRDSVKESFARFATGQQSLQTLSDDLAKDSGSWGDFKAEIDAAMHEGLQADGMLGLRRLCQHMLVEAGDGEFSEDHLAHASHAPPAPQGRRPRDASILERLGIERVDHGLHERRHRWRTHERAREVWRLLLDKVAAYIREWEGWLDTLDQRLQTLQRFAHSAAAATAAQISPLRANGDRETSTYYDLETGVFGPELVEEFWGQTVGALDPALRERIGAMAYALAGEALENQTLLDGLVEQLTATPDLRRRVERAFDLQHVVAYQHRTKHRPTNHRIDQFFQRLGPHAAVDGDTYPYTEANQEPTQLMTVPDLVSGGDGASEALRRALRNHNQFQQIQITEADRMDAVHIVHGLPVGQLTSIPELYRQYHGGDPQSNGDPPLVSKSGFAKTTLHLNPLWADPQVAALDEIYPPRLNGSGNGHPPSPAAGANGGPPDPTNGAAPPATGPGAASAAPPVPGPAAPSAPQPPSRRQPI